jgi:hypothetical protein
MEPSLAATLVIAAQGGVGKTSSRATEGPGGAPSLGPDDVHRRCILAGCLSGHAGNGPADGLCVKECLCAR